MRPEYIDAVTGTAKLVRDVLNSEKSVGYVERRGNACWDDLCSGAYLDGLSRGVIGAAFLINRYDFTTAEAAAFSRDVFYRVWSEGAQG